MSTEVEEARDELLHCTVSLWRGDEWLGKHESWGTSTDVAAAVLQAFDGDDAADRMTFEVKRGLPDGMVPAPRPSDPRSEP